MAALALAVLAVFFLPVGWVPYIVRTLSPFVGLTSSICTRTVSITALLSLPILLLILRRKRWFCQRLCPVGLICEGCGKLGGKKSRRSIKWCPALGRWGAIGTLAAAAVGFPLVLALDPIAILFAAINAAGQPGTWAVGLALAPLLLIGLISIPFPHLWCGRFCPLGGFQDLLTDIRSLLVPREKGTVQKGGRRVDIMRRSFIGVALGTLIGKCGRGLPANSPKRLRPPGAVEEQTFKSLCVRCGSCTRVCPTRILTPDINPPDLPGCLAPRLSFDNLRGCVSDCKACSDVCPSGAISNFTIEEKPLQTIGRLVIDHEACLLFQDTECGFCLDLCPYKALRSEFSRETWTASVVVAADQCNGCGLCLKACPTEEIVMRIQPVGS
ncbi:MAG: 4Fe-4S dicluster domain-containing protein [Fuerstiella sp.]|nr:4Fe-4S dicluster domain-containing protein [Fuerstiella sp.]